MLWLPYQIQMLLANYMTLQYDASYIIWKIYLRISNLIVLFFRCLQTLTLEKALIGDFIKLGKFTGKTKCFHFSLFSDFCCRAIHVYVDFPMGSDLFQANLWWISFSWLKGVLFNLRLWQIYKTEMKPKIDLFAF